MYDPTHKSILPARAKDSMSREATTVRGEIADLVSKPEESDSLETEIRSAKTRELYAAQDDVFKNAEKRAATLEEEGNFDDADAALRAAERIAQKIDSLRDHRLQERREAQNNDIPIALQ